MAPPLFFLNSDARVLNLVRQGDEEGLVLLFEMNRRAVASLVRNHGGTADDADDILQEAVVIFWERVKAGTFEQKAKLSTFIYATARNLWLRRRAKSRREVAGDPDPEATEDPSHSALEDLIESQEATAIRHALEELGDPCKTLLLLYYWEEKSMSEIAEQMGFANAETAKSKKYQCKKALEEIVRKRS
ncbi:MAG TPA: sigma-70 family RNA polymerase sigma factor [Bacteroidota bacterium]|nr:sigma-70 family RNA polymerase sigma factor [Bacteroidota bacterium]